MRAAGAALGFALPLALLLFGAVTMRTEVSLGSEAGVLYGFPWPWYAPSAAGSMAYDIALGALAADLLVYLAGAWLLVRLLAPARLPARWRRPALALLWAAALAAGAATALALGDDPGFVAWDPGAGFAGAGTRAHHWQWGAGGWR